MSETIFHKILRKEIPAEIVFEDEQCLAIKDIQPVAPTHLLIIPKKSIPTIDALESADAHLIGHMVLVAKDLAKQTGISAGGYRLVLNCGEEGGQTVFQLHLHLIGGRVCGWPPG